MSDTVDAQQLTRGGETVGLISNMLEWEAELVLNFRCWVNDETGRNNVRSSFSRTFSSDRATDELWAFDKFLATIAENSYYPIAHHDPECPCLGAHEAILTNMVRLASSGFLLEASQIASLIALPSKAESISLMAIRIGHAMRQIVRTPYKQQISLSTAYHRIH
jgi:hypothetical protein